MFDFIQQLCYIDIICSLVQDKRIVEMKNN